ncbi:MAG: hypothetical protein V4550_18195 [Gemmatimonadota bacterium]
MEMLKYPCDGCGKIVDFDGEKGCLRGEVSGIGVVQNHTVIACCWDCVETAKANYKEAMRLDFEDWMKRFDELRLGRVL